jgi:hypothetical protein
MTQSIVIQGRLVKNCLFYFAFQKLWFLMPYFFCYFIVGQCGNQVVLPYPYHTYKVVLFCPNVTRLNALSIYHFCTLDRVSFLGSGFARACKHK